MRKAKAHSVGTLIHRDKHHEIYQKYEDGLLVTNIYNRRGFFANSIDGSGDSILEEVRRIAGNNIASVATDIFGNEIHKGKNGRPQARKAGKKASKER